MKREIIGMVLLSVLLAGCRADSVYTPGTYQAEAPGFGGALTVAVTFSETAITDVTVQGNHETKDIADKALADIPKKIVEVQSSDVDSVSGATMTSEAIKTAVSNCIHQAEKG